MSRFDLVSCYYFFSPRNMFDKFKILVLICRFEFHKALKTVLIIYIVIINNID